MTEEEMQERVDEIARLAQEHGFDRIAVAIEIRAGAEPRASMMHGRNYEWLFGRGSTVAEALDDLQRLIVAAEGKA